MASCLRKVLRSLLQQKLSGCGTNFRKVSALCSGKIFMKFDETSRISFRDNILKLGNKMNCIFASAFDILALFGF